MAICARLEGKDVYKWILKKDMGFKVDLLGGIMVLGKEGSC